MTNTVNIFLLLFGALQGVLLGFVIFRRRRKDLSSLYLTLFLVLAGVQLTLKVISKTWLSDQFPLLCEVSYFLPFLAGPLLYFFIRSHAAVNQRGLDALHMLPFVLGASYAILVAKFGYVLTTPVDRSLLRAFPRGAMQMISVGIYGLACFRIIAHEVTSLSRKPLQQFVLVAIGAEGLIIIAIAVLQRFYGSVPDMRLLFIALTIMIYWISYKVIIHPDVFLSAGPVLIPLKTNSAPRYAHSGLKHEEANRIAQLLREAMAKQKLYLRENLSIEGLASELKISRHHLSQVLNEKFQQNYFDFVNGYRLEEASLRLTSQKYRHYTIAAIARDSGFTSVSNFNELFKRRYEVTPSRFRDKHGDKMSA